MDLQKQITILSICYIFSTFWILMVCIGLHAKYIKMNEQFITLLQWHGTMAREWRQLKGLDTPDELNKEIASYFNEKNKK